jgi:hypothetical protein
MICRELLHQICYLGLVVLLLAGCTGTRVKPTTTRTSGFVEIEGARIYYEMMGKGALWC